MIGSIDKAYFRYGLVKVYQRWLSYFAFEGRQITARGRWLNLFVFGGLRLLAAWPGSPRAHSPIFITGLGRSGTTILGILLSLHRDVGHLSEPKALWHVIDPRQDINSNFSTSGGQYRLGADDASPTIARRAHRLYGRYLGLARARRVVDKYPEMIFRVGYLRALFPDAKFIFIVRSGTDAVASVVNWSEKWGSVSSQGQRDWWGRNDIKWHYLRDQVLLRDPAYASVAACIAGEVDHANRAALEWVVTMREGLAQERLHPDAVVRISYERLTEHPVEELRRLQSACGLVPDPAVEDYAQGRLYENPLKNFPELIPEVADLFRRTMLEMGYT